MILHITTLQEWEQAKLAGEYTSPSLDSVGFVHCSTLKQVVNSANLFFKDQHGLVVLCIDEGKLTCECKYEDPTGGAIQDLSVGQLFPHVYGPINMSAIIKVVDFPCGENGLFKLPQELM